MRPSNGNLRFVAGTKKADKIMDYFIFWFSLVSGDSERSGVGAFLRQGGWAFLNFYGVVGR